MTLTLAKWTIDEYHLMIEAGLLLQSDVLRTANPRSGLLDNRSVELIQGEIVEMSLLR